MKKILFVALCIMGLLSQTAHAQSSVVFKQQAPVGFDQATNAEMAFNSPAFSEYAPDAKDYRTSRRYKEAVSKRNAGIALTVVGGTFLVGGPALLGYGINGLINNNHSLYSEDGLTTLGYGISAAFGAILSAAGVAMLVPGVILLTKGSKKMKAARTDN